MLPVLSLRDADLNDAIFSPMVRFLVNDQSLVFLMEKSRRRSPSVDPFNHQKSSRYSSLVAVGLWLSFIGLNWTSFSWYAARINSLALSSCLALKHLYKYRVFLKYLDLSSHVLRESTSYRQFKCLQRQFVRHYQRSRVFYIRKYFVTRLSFSSEIHMYYCSRSSNCVLVISHARKLFHVVSFSRSDCAELFCYVGAINSCELLLVIDYSDIFEHLVYG